jgi:hypothetical protein
MTLAVAPTDEQGLRRLHGAIDELRVLLDGDASRIRTRCQTYLNWYSPEFNERLGTHDAWVEPVSVEEVGLTRANFPISRAVVDIWTSLEAAKPPVGRAEPERLPPPVPDMDEAEAARQRELYKMLRSIEGMKSNLRSARVRTWMRRDHFALKHFRAVRRKNLYGFAWQKVIPNGRRRAPVSTVLRNPATVYPVWSDRDPDDLEAILVAHEMAASKANQLYNLGLKMAGAVIIGTQDGRYRRLENTWVDSERTMLWVEELWWVERDYRPDGSISSSRVHMATRVFDQIVDHQVYEGWTDVPFVGWENTDERGSIGWSDIASVIDINDEFNRRLSQEGDIIGGYSAPRYQLINSMVGRTVEMPGPFELIALNDQERIEQILTRIDVYPTQQHFQILTDLLHRVSGLPPVVWGLIANAQTSGRALTASWKATEARLAPKLMRNEQSLDRWLSISLNYARLYDWDGAKRIFDDRDGRPFEDFRWAFPPMEPRDFQEVTANAITKRDAGLQTTIQAMRETGEEAAEDMLEEVLAEYQDIFLHPDKRQAYLLAQNADLQNQLLAIQLQNQGGGQGPASFATTAQAVGAGREAAVNAAQQGGALGTGEGPLPPTMAGAPGNAGVQGPTALSEQTPTAPGAGPGAGAAPAGTPATTTGTLFRNGQISNQIMQTGKM